MSCEARGRRAVALCPLAGARPKFSDVFRVEGLEEEASKSCHESVVQIFWRGPKHEITLDL